MAPADSFEGFIFDYGGVLVEHQSDEDQARMAAIARIPTETFGELYWADRLDYDKGLLTGPEYWHGLAGKGGSTLTQAQIDELTEIDTQSWMRYDPVMWEWIAQLRQAGKRVAMLSNMTRDL